MKPVSGCCADINSSRLCHEIDGQGERVPVPIHGRLTTIGEIQGLGAALRESVLQQLTRRAGTAKRNASHIRQT
jgi:hypothetical protein